MLIEQLFEKAKMGFLKRSSTQVVQHCVTLHVRHIWVCTPAQQVAKDFCVSLVSSDVHGCAAKVVLPQQAGPTMIKQQFDDKWITSTDCLIPNYLKRKPTKFNALRTPLFTSG